MRRGQSVAWLFGAERQQRLCRHDPDRHREHDDRKKQQRHERRDAERKATAAAAGRIVENGSAG